jgi:hypothetical protein
MKTSYEKFMASSANNPMKVELGLIDDIGTAIKNFDAISIVGPIRKEAEKANNIMLVKSKELKDIQDKIAKAKISLKELGADTKDVDGYEKMVQNQVRVISLLMKGINDARFIDNI